MRDHLLKYQAYFPAAFFLLGFLFDLLTTDRIDQAFSLWQQVIYLMFLMVLMAWEVSPPRFIESGDNWVQKVWSYHTEIVHFLFGSLLSLYTIFYFKSGSFEASFLFIVILAALLVLNEIPRFQSLGTILRFSMLALCMISYFVYLVPVVTGEIGLLSFLLSLVISVGIFLYMALRIDRRTKNPDVVIRKIIVPGVAIHLVFCALYFFKVLPPVPLSLKDIGVYHKVVRTEDDYRLTYEKADWWRFWDDSAHTFRAETGDKVYCFVRVFSPTDFKDQLQLVWYKYDRSGWSRWDAIPLTIQGGRSAGFRGTANKANYAPGDWQIRVLTSDGREMGRKRFRIVDRDPGLGPRVWQQIQK